MRASTLTQKRARSTAFIRWAFSLAQRLRHGLFVFSALALQADLFSVGQPSSIRIDEKGMALPKREDRVPRRGVALAVAVLPDRAGNGSACGWQADER
ncbi:hypothetical protein, partial [Pseudorhizobium flavum]|uniref:hypothetical protein n=1 Tax=Pseudorhizobium flavum TaxID=1335061 RepID=UPI001AEDC547